MYSTNTDSQTLIDRFYSIRKEHILSSGIAKFLFCFLGAFCLPFFAEANELSRFIGDFNRIMDDVSRTLQGDTQSLQSGAKAIAGMGAVFFIGSRVWKHIANAEAVDFYPLFRPFVLAILIANFAWVTGFIQILISPVMTASNRMMANSQLGIDQLIAAKQEAMKNGKFWNMYVGESGSGDRDLWYEYSNPGAGEEGWMESIGNGIRFAMEKASYQMQLNAKAWISEVLQVLYQAAGLAINVIRLFYLVILGILGPISFGLAVFDGFQHTLVQWVARYVNVYLWLPVANIFGYIINRIQEEMLKLDISQIEDQGRTFFSSTDTAFLIFMTVAIIGYATVPSVANYIIYAGGKDSLLHKTSNIASHYPNQFQKMLR
jgi:conjugative transposon TraJ protein